MGRGELVRFSQSAETPGMRWMKKVLVERLMRKHGNMPPKISNIPEWPDRPGICQSSTARRLIFFPWIHFRLHPLLSPLSGGKLLKISFVYLCFICMFIDS